MDVFLSFQAVNSGVRTSCASPKEFIVDETKFCCHFCSFPLYLRRISSPAWSNPPEISECSPCEPGGAVPPFHLLTPTGKSCSWDFFGVFFLPYPAVPNSRLLHPSSGFPWIDSLTKVTPGWVSQGSYLFEMLSGQYSGIPGRIFLGVIGIMLNSTILTANLLHLRTPCQILIFFLWN